MLCAEKRESNARTPRATWIDKNRTGIARIFDRHFGRKFGYGDTYARIRVGAIEPVQGYFQLCALKDIKARIEFKFFSCVDLGDGQWLGSVRVGAYGVRARLGSHPTGKTLEWRWCGGIPRAQSHSVINPQAAFNGVVHVA